MMMYTYGERKDGDYLILDNNERMSGNDVVVRLRSLESQNAALLEALETIAKHDGSDNFVAKHLVGIANEAIRKAQNT